VFQIIVLIGAINLGIFISAFARNEFQMVQFIPLIILPQVFLCGILWPVDQMNNVLQWIAKFLPLTYAVEGLRDVMLNGKSLAEVGFDLVILAAFAVGISVITALTLRRSAGS
jgi:ABC-2 type transport system permease protein